MRTTERSYISPRKSGVALSLQKAQVTEGILGELQKLGICIGQDQLTEMTAYAMDSLTATQTPTSIGTPAQFLQAWLPGFVRLITKARKIDLLVGVVTAGDWEDEEVIQGVMELTGSAVPYTDYGNVPLSSWNASWERRSIVRFEEGLQVSRLEEAQAAKMRVNSAEEKRGAAALALEIQRNDVGFYGYNGGANRTYGFLNDPALGAYVTVAAGVNGTEWSGKTFLEITADLREAFSTLRIQSGDTIDPDTAQITLAIPTGSQEWLGVTNEIGSLSVRDWLKSTYPNTRIESAPQLAGADGGEDVFYLYAESVDDGATDDGRTIVQIVPAKFMTLGVEQRAKSYLEDFTNATAGVMTKRPYAVVRRSGI